jgi:hypothetical protein
VPIDFHIDEDGVITVKDATGNPIEKKAEYVTLLRRSSPLLSSASSKILVGISNGL